MKKYIVTRTIKDRYNTEDEGNPIVEICGDIETARIALRNVLIEDLDVLHGAKEKFDTIDEWFDAMKENDWLLISPNEDHAEILHDTSEYAYYYNIYCMDV